AGSGGGSSGSRSRGILGRDDDLAESDKNIAVTTTTSIQRDTHGGSRSTSTRKQTKRTKESSSRAESPPGDGVTTKQDGDFDFSGGDSGSPVEDEESPSSSSSATSLYDLEDGAFLGATSAQLDKGTNYAGRCRYMKR
ncbi:unnamed protein product, partial [Amoebophrya sp. A25]